MKLKKGKIICIGVVAIIFAVSWQSSHAGLLDSVKSAVDSKSDSSESSSGDTVQFSASSTSGGKIKSPAVKFETKGNIYGIAKLNDTLKKINNAQNNNQEISVWVKIQLHNEGGGEQIVTIKAGDSIANTKDLPFRIVVDPSLPLEPNTLNVNFYKTLANVKSGKTVNCEVTIFSPDKYNQIAAGNFQLTTTEQGIKRYESWANNEKNSEAKKRFMPAPKMKNAALEKAMSAEFNKRFSDTMTLMRLIIVESDWTIERNKSTNVIIRRFVRVAVGVKFKSGGDSEVLFYEFYQDYDGKKFQDKVYMPFGSLKSYKIDEANISKNTFENQ
jgi:hypothetical protein